MSPLKLLGTNVRAVIKTIADGGEWHKIYTKIGFRHYVYKYTIIEISMF